MKKLIVLSLATFIVLLSSCTSMSVYLPAVTGNDITYMPKPMGSDSIKVKNYISGSIAGISLPYSTGNLDMGFVNFSRAHTFKNFNIAYGAFGYAGATSYYGDKDKITNAATLDFDRKGFIGGGLRSSIGFYDANGNTEFRILSWENVLSFEGGSYANFRERMNGLNHPDIVSSTKTTTYTTGGATEIIFHAKKNNANQFALKLFYGVTPGLRRSLQSPYQDYSTNGAGAFNFSFYFKLNKLFGVLDAGTNRGFSNKFTLGYAF